MGYGGGVAVAGEDLGGGGEGEEVGADGVEEGFVISAGEVGAADAAGEKDVAGYYPVACGIVERYAAG